jgi:hypothetical protein
MLTGNVSTQVVGMFGKLDIVAWGPEATEIRLWMKVDRSSESGCWPWKGGLSRYGYGCFWTGGRTAPAHRAVYESVVGPVPPGLQIDHVCHNRDPKCVGGPQCLHRRCVNPAHLEAVTPRVNVTRGCWRTR